jgi:hypothetical protein
MQAEATPSFEDAQQVGQVELDRYCTGCGYNLRQQPVRREPTTQLLLCRCPECGDFSPANQATTRPRSWFANLVLILWIVWIAALGAALAAAVAINIDLSDQLGQGVSETEKLDVPIPDPRVTSGDNVRTISFQYVIADLDRPTIVKLALVLLGALATGAGLLAIAVLFVPHWSARGYAILAASWPILGMIGFYGTRMIDAYTYIYASDELKRWIILSPVLVAFFSITAGITAACLARPVARLVVRIAIPARQRGPFAYLWLVDGKAVPIVKP